MKKLLLLLSVCILAVSCSKEPADSTNEPYPPRARTEWDSELIAYTNTTGSVTNDMSVTHYSRTEGNNGIIGKFEIDDSLFNIVMTFDIDGYTIVETTHKDTGTTVTNKLSYNIQKYSDSFFIIDKFIDGAFSGRSFYKVDGNNFWFVLNYKDNGQTIYPPQYIP